MPHESLSLHPTQTWAAAVSQVTRLQANSVCARTACPGRRGGQEKSRTAAFDWFCRYDETLLRPDESSVFGSSRIAL